tara:strand:+ start:586 stop:1284 length:699 start_codon:yes stop_codon:yes gene_type:complete
MRFKIITLFPEIFPGALKYSITGRALANANFNIETIDIRNFSDDKHKTVDDKPFGGGPGMILKADSLQKSLESINKKKNQKIISLSPSGKLMNQKFLKKIINFDEIILICGRYEGIDQRFIDFNDIEEVSLGDYIISGGELAAFIIIDACVRLIPEVLGNEKSLNEESFNKNLLEYPQYTKPSIWRKLNVPEILLSGDHKKISEWRRKKSIEKTKKTRPDLWKLYKGNESEN